MIWRKTIGLFLIPILLWAGMGFMLSRHYCFDELISEHLYHSEDSCGMDILRGDEPCHDDHDESHFNEDNCCRNEWIQIDNIETVNHKPELSGVEFLNPDLNAVLSYHLCIELNHDQLSGSDSSPPRYLQFIKTSDFLASSQCYLI